MENPTSFDLNAALQRWRENLAASAAMKREDIAELEAHLRDSMVALEAKGLSAGEAFWVARSRLGGDELVQEFGKVNREQVWLNRALWMVAGGIVLNLISGWATALARLVVVIPAALQQLAAGWELIAVDTPRWQVGIWSTPALLYPFVLVGLLAGAWWLLNRAGGRIGRLVGAARQRPVATGLMALALLALNIGLTMGSWALLYRTLPMEASASAMKWQYLTVAVQWLYLPLTLAWLLRRQSRIESCRQRA